MAVIDFEAAVIDGALPAARAQAHRRADGREARRRSTPRACRPIAVVEGSIGNRARAIGAASLPLLAKFMRDRELLFRTPGEGSPLGRARRPPTAARLLNRPSQKEEPA